jgi:predicted dienelactone hydrolase
LTLLVNLRCRWSWLDLMPVQFVRPALLAAASCLVLQAPARALEQVVIDFPVLETTLTLNLSELSSPEALINGSSDLAELDRASDGALGRKLLTLFNHPLPASLRQAADAAVGSPLLEQALLFLSSLGSIEGRSADLSGETLKQALDRASASAANGQPTVRHLMQAIPGKRVRLDLGRVDFIFARMVRHHIQADRLMATVPTAAPAPAQQLDAPLRISRPQLPVRHRAEPLELVVIQPTTGSNGRLVLISHGLWDTPLNFEGWARVLATHGYTVVLPYHPGSDKSEQHEVLTGKAPPPSAAELGLRALDLQAVIDGVAQNQLSGVSGVDASQVVVIGHSWGATTALQVAGVKPDDSQLLKRCDNIDDPDRNLSWELQCSWIRGVNQAAIVDPRVIAVAAVSPPLSLLFPRGSGRDMNGRILLVSGTQDWVVPPDPEAIAPFTIAAARGHQLVLVKGGNHFNLRPGQAADGGVLAPLLLKWTKRAFMAGSAARPAKGAPPLQRCPRATGAALKCRWPM